MPSLNAKDLDIRIDTLQGVNYLVFSTPYNEGLLYYKIYLSTSATVVLTELIQFAVIFSMGLDTTVLLPST